MTKLEAGIVLDLASAGATEAMEAILRKAALAPDLRGEILVMSLAMIEAKARTARAFLGPQLGRDFAAALDTMVAAEMRKNSEDLAGAVSAIAAKRPAGAAAHG